MERSLAPVPLMVSDPLSVISSSIPPRVIVCAILNSGDANSMMSSVVEALAAAMASLREQSASHAPSSVSAVLL